MAWVVASVIHGHPVASLKYDSVALKIRAGYQVGICMRWEATAGNSGSAFGWDEDGSPPFD